VPKSRGERQRGCPRRASNPDIVSALRAGAVSSRGSVCEIAEGERKDEVANCSRDAVITKSLRILAAPLPCSASELSGRLTIEFAALTRVAPAADPASQRWLSI
jgi:hypothetical protein